MSVEADITRIQDEELLRRMWQDTEDFGRKKEIRAHMYKVREARLKDFYNSEISNNESQSKSSQKSTDFERNFANAQKTNMTTTHADNLADDSFLSYKSKEIRDSESPTRDVGYRSLGKIQDQGWNITSTNEQSTDGKTESTSIKANTSGTQAINGGKLLFDAQHEQKASVFQDGDDRNFVKSADAQSNSVIHQEACGGDEHSKFRTSTTKCSSSSRYVSESKSSTGDLEQIPSNATTRDKNTSEEHSTKIYTRNAPDEIKSHPSYVEGKTKVTQETKTLADGSTVTTTRYETKIGNSTQTAVTKKYSNIASSKSEQKLTSSSTSSYHQSSRSNFATDSKLRSKDSQKAIEYHIEPVGITGTERRTSTVRETSSKRNKNKHDEVDYVEFIVEPVIKMKNDQHYSTTTQTSTKHSNESADSRTPVDYVVQPATTIEIDINTVDSRRNEDVRSSSKTEKFLAQETSNIVRETKHDEQDFTTTKTHRTQDVPSETTTTTKTTTTIITEGKTPRDVTDATYSTTFSTNVNEKQDIRDFNKVTTDKFISTERKNKKDTRETTQKGQTTQPKEPRGPSPQKESQARGPKSSEEPYVQPERRQPIKPTKSEIDRQQKPTDGMYDTTYKSEFTSKKISVEQSAAHDAFARSLRAVTPERVRSSVSPDKSRFPNRASPERRSDRGRSPRKSTDRLSSTETITYTTRGRDTPTRYTSNDVTTKSTYSTDTITRKSKATSDSCNSSTLTRRKTKPRDYSPTEYKRQSVHDISTDLDFDVTTTVTDKKITTRPSSLEFSRKPKKITERSPTSPLNELVSPKRSPVHESPRKSQSPTNETTSPGQERPKLIRTDTYEERVKQILGITSDITERRRSSLERSTLTKKGSFRETTTRSSSNNDFNRSSSKESPTKSPERKSPVKEKVKVAGYPSQMRKSPEKEPFRKSPSKERQPLQKYPDRKSPVKDSAKISEFPSQVRKSPEKHPLEPYPEKKSPAKDSSKISEFPCQIRKSPERQNLEKYPERRAPVKESPKVSEFPSQVRKSPEKQPLEPYPKKKSPVKEIPKISEFPAQTRKSPERQPLEKYPEREPPVKESPKVSEFPSQVRKSPEKQTLEPYPERKSPVKEIPNISEFPAQIRKSPERQPLEKYSERESPVKESPKVSEYPSQVRKSPEKQPLEPYPKKKSPVKEIPKISEFPAQIRKSPDRQPLEKYPERESPVKETPKVSEFPSQVRKLPEKQPMEPYPERKSPVKEIPKISEFTAQTRKSPERQPLEKYPERESAVKEVPKVSEFARQVRKSSEKEPEPHSDRAPLESYPEKTLPAKEAPKISELPSQIRKSPEKQPLEIYPERKSPTKDAPMICEFPSQIRKSPEREPFEEYPEKQSPIKETPTKNIPQTSEFSAPSKKSCERQNLKSVPEKQAPTMSEFPTQIHKSPEKEPLEPYPKKKPEKMQPTVSEFPAQIRKSPERETLDTCSQVSTNVSKTKKLKKIRTDSESTTTSDESDREQTIEETVTQTTIDSLENKIPVEEPLILKKLFSNLCREDEVITIDKKKATQNLIESEIIQNQIEQQVIDSTVVKKDKLEHKLPTLSLKKPSEGPKKLTEPLKSPEKPKKPAEISKKPIDKKPSEISSTKPREPLRKPASRTDIHTITKSESNTSITKATSTKRTSQKDKSPVKAPSKKNIIETTTTTTKKITTKEMARSPQPTKSSTIPKKTPEIYLTTKTKFIGGTEYQNEYCKTTQSQKDITMKKPLKPTERITLYNVENLKNLQEDKSTYIRSNRVDDTVNKKKTSVVTTKTELINGDVTKTKSKDGPKYLSPTKKVPSKTNITKTPTKTTTTTQNKSSSTTVRNKTTNTEDQKLKEFKPTTFKKHKVTTSVNLITKTSPQTKKPSTPDKPVLTKTTTTKKPVKSVEGQNGYSSSDTDDESITESANHSFVNITEAKRFSTTSNDQVFETIPKQPDVISTVETETKTHKATKTVLITDKEGRQYQVMVDLKRSKSSREPTPDRLCPRPMTSDEEEDDELPRYPDQISEPDDGSLKRKSKRLSDIPILESEDTTEATRITEVTDAKTTKISEVDKVEETDESLLSVTKKVQKFLNTADKLTKQPTTVKANKVKRPEFEVTEDLKSDECLLSVSDKVSKFITTAEQLVTPKSIPERPKTPVCQNYKEEINVSIQKKKTELQTNIEEVNKPRREAPAPKVDRPDVTKVDENLKEDECLMSVSDKVTKFISTAEKLTTTSTSNKSISLAKIDIKPKEELRPIADRKSPVKEVSRAKSPTKNVTIVSEKQIPRKSPSLSPERRSPSPNKTPDRKPSNQYNSILKTETVESKYPPSSVLLESTPKSSRKPSVEDTKPDSTFRRRSQEESTTLTAQRSSQEDTKTVLSTTSRLRSTESIKKAKALFENISKDQETPKQRDILSRPSVFEARRNQTDRHIDLSRKKLDFTEKEDQIGSTTTVLTKTSRKSPEKSPERVSEHPKSPVSDRPRSPEKIEVTRFRPSSPDKIPEVSGGRPRSREPSPGEIPHYMLPLDRSLRPHSPHRESVTPTTLQQQPQSIDEVDIRQTKFGVTLKRTDSGRVIKSTETSNAVTERRKSSVTLEKRVTEEEIEEIFELEVLEELLEKVIGYDLRRKIRTQIRLVKKLISEGTLEEYIVKRNQEQEEILLRKQNRRTSSPKRGASPSKTLKHPEISKNTEYTSSHPRKVSPERKPVIDNKLYQPTDLVDTTQQIQESSEYSSSYILKTRKSSSDYSTKATSRKSPAKERTSPVKDRVRSSPVKERASPIRNGYLTNGKSPSPSREWISSCNRRDSETRVSKTVETTPYGKTTTVKTSEKTPNGLKTTTTKTAESKMFSTLKKSSPQNRSPQDEVPEWIKSRNLRKTTQTSAPVSNKRTTSTTTTTKKTTTSRSSPVKEIRGTDIITSSYGVGPTDENGTPLFGLRALRAKNNNNKVETKVQGTVIQSQFYSENGHEPVGQVSVTEYSTDPKDLHQNGVFHKDGAVTSVTTTQKFGYEDTPSLKSLTDNRKEISDTTHEETITSKTSRINRRGSVKALSQKFIDNAVETLKSERQTTYPKAGLILRTSSFKSSGDERSDSRETSPVETDLVDNSMTVRTTKTASTTTGETFLTNKSKIMGVQDVLTRMKNEEYQEGDSPEDAKARGLLNKFLGAQVMLSGMESHISSKAKTSVTTSPTGAVKKSTTVTTTVTEGGRPTTTTRIFHHPVTEEELETVWEEQTLKLLLEQSSEYEERRFIRVRLRQLMAEQEACTALVDQATKDDSVPSTPTTPTIATGIEEQIETSKEVKKNGDVTTTKVTTKVTTQQQQTKSTKPLSPFAKFRQLDKQNSLNNPTPPSTPGTPRGSGALFKFTDPNLTQSASTIKERLLHWCRMKTKEYENIQLNNFSSSWADGLAFCALVHHFLPDSFDYSALTSKDRRHNFELAFRIADEKADIAPLLDVEDMLETTRPDWKCVFTYVQSIYRRFKDED